MALRCWEETRDAAQNRPSESMAYILLQLSWRLPDPWTLVGFASTALIAIAQSYANKINEAASPNHERNDRFRGLNWVGIVCGGILLSFALIGFFMPMPEES